MKQFSLDEYLANPSKKIITRDGRNVTRILCTDLKNEFSVVAVIESKNGTSEQALSFKKDGTYSCYSPNVADLFFAQEKHEGWVNIFRNKGSINYYTSIPYNSEKEAIRIGSSSENYITTAKVEGEG